MSSDTLARVIRVTLDHMGDAHGALDADTRLSDLGLDSFERIQLVLDLEEDFGVELHDDDVEFASTLGALARAVEAARARASA